MTKTRIISALIMAPIAIALILLLPTSWLIALIAVVFAVGLWEWFALSDTEDTLSRALLVAANLAVMSALVWGSKVGTGNSTAPFMILTILGALWWCIAPLWLKNRSFGSHHEGWSKVLKLGVGSIVFLSAWSAMAMIHGSEPHGNRWLLVALVCVWAADSGAYFTGKFLGKRKMAPNISPNKTVEGLVGGLAASVLFGLLFAWIAQVDQNDVMKVALVLLITAGFSVIGDLFESLLKRQAGVKDSGNVIPGHGGILDRIDAVLAAMPIFALGKLIFGF